MSRLASWRNRGGATRNLGGTDGRELGLGSCCRCYVLSLDAGSKLRVSKSKPDFRRWMEGLVVGWIGG